MKKRKVQTAMEVTNEPEICMGERYVEDKNSETVGEAYARMLAMGQLNMNGVKGNALSKEQAYRCMEHSRLAPNYMTDNECRNDLENTMKNVNLIKEISENREEEIKKMKLEKVNNG